MLNEQTIRALLTRVSRREEGVEEALAALRVLPFEDLGFAKLDHHRQLRRGVFRK
jgi:NCAIR mutase (PurE)-related protein